MTDLMHSHPYMMWWCMPQQPLEVAIVKGIEYHTKKYGRKPNHVYISMSKEILTVDGVLVEHGTHIANQIIYIGVKS